MKSKKKIIAIVITLLIILAGAAFAYLYFFTDMFKTPEELFYKYVGKAAKTESKYDYQDMLEELKTAQTKSYTGKTNVGIELKSTGTSYSSRKNQATYNVINGIGLEIDTKSNPSEKKAQYNVKMNYSGVDVAELELVRDNDLYGIKSDFLDDKYIAVENNNLKDLVKKLGGSTTNIPDKLEFLDMYELLYISKEDQDKITSTYEKVIKENITSDKFKKVENVIQKVNGIDKNTTVYALSINEKEFYNIILKVLETAKQDDFTLNLIVDKVNTYIEKNPAIQSYIAGSSSYSSLSRKSAIKTKLTKNNLVDALEEMIDEIEDEVKYADENSVAEVVVYVAEGETVRIELRLDEKITAAMDFYVENDKNHIVLYALANQYSKYSYSYSRSASKELAKIMEMEYKTTKNGDETISEGNFVFYDDDEEELKMSFDITTKGKVGQGQNISNCKLTLEADEMSVGLTIDSEIEYTDNVEIEDLNSRNSNILNDMSKTELEEFFEEIEENFEEKLEEEMEDFGLTNATTPRTTNSSLFNL